MSSENEKDCGRGGSRDRGHRLVGTLVVYVVYVPDNFVRSLISAGLGITFGTILATLIKFKL